MLCYGTYSLYPTQVCFILIHITQHKPRGIQSTGCTLADTHCNNRSDLYLYMYIITFILGDYSSIICT